MPDRSSPAAGARDPRVMGLLLALIVIAVAARSLGHDFVVLDDRAWVVDNARVQAGLTLDGMRWAFDTRFGGAWQPLVWWSWMLDRTLFGPGPMGFHATNLILFAASAVLLFSALRRLIGRTGPAFAIALLWALHPVQVESVAWVAERKGLLAGLFWMLAMEIFSRGDGRGAGARAGVFVCTVLGLMAKSTLLALPFVLILLDAGLRGRRGVRALLLPRLELLLILPLFVAVGVGAQADAGAMRGVAESVGGWSAVAASYLHALRSVVWPAGLSPVYAAPADGFPLAHGLLALAVLVGISLAVVRFGRTRPGVWLGWTWFLGGFLPFSGIVAVGGHYTADRYLLVPLAGLVWMLVAGGEELLARRGSAAPRIALVVLAVVWGGLSVRQQGVWSDSVTLFEHARAVDRTDPLAAYWLGEATMRAGDAARAVENFRDARTLRPGYDLAWFQEGSRLLDLRRADEAAHALEQYLALRPHQFKGWMNLGAAYGQLGRLEDALRCFERAVEIAPNDRRANANRDRARALLERRGGPAP